MGSPSRKFRGNSASGDFRGIKADIREGGHRVPFLVRWPGHWKYIDAPGSGGWSQFDEKAAHPKQLYNLESDPYETNNQYFEEIEIAAQLQRTLDQIKNNESPESRKAQARI